MPRTPPPDTPDDDKTLWETVTRSVKPLSRRKPPVRGTSKTERKVQPAKKIANTPTKPREISPPAPPTPMRGFDTATATRLRQGRLPIEGRIDLHGMTQDEAFRALGRFLAKADRYGWRTLLVITGKGRVSEGGGVLRRMLPIWLEDGIWHNRVLACVPAQPRDGGSGAFYLRLRKPSTKN